MAMTRLAFLPSREKWIVMDTIKRFQLPCSLTEIHTDGFRSNVVIDHSTEIGENLVQSLTGGEVIPRGYPVEQKHTRSSLLTSDSEI